MIALIQQFGYPALFLALFLSVVGLPLPDEAVAMGAGVAVSMGLLSPWAAVSATMLGVAASRTASYAVGRLAGAPLLARLGRGQERIAWARAGLDRYGALALAASTFVPVLRHLLPCLAGVNRMPFRRFALASYTAGAVWGLVYFLLGRQTAGLWSANPGYLAVAGLAAGLLVWRLGRSRSAA